MNLCPSVNIFNNGVVSAVRITENTTMAIPEMTRIGSARNADTETMLDLSTGTVLGNVKKLTANSRYEIKTPHGVAGIRGTDFQVTVTLEGVTTFTSVLGEVIVSAVINNVPVVKVLRTGESWTPAPGTDVVPVPAPLLQQMQKDATTVTTTVATAIATATAAVTTPPTTKPAFSTGSTPSGNPSSSNGTPATSPTSP